MTTSSATSTNVRAVGYESSTRRLRVQFRCGGVYDYHGVDPHLFEQLLLPNPWRHIGHLVKAHPYARVAWPMPTPARSPNVPFPDFVGPHP